MTNFIRVISTSTGKEMFINANSINGVYEAMDDFDEWNTVISFANLYEPVKESVNDVMSKIYDVQ